MQSRFRIIVVACAAGSCLFLAWAGAGHAQIWRPDKTVEINIPIACGGVAVLPGDAVLADSGGIFVCAAAEIEEIFQTALPMQQRESATLQRLRAGEKLGVISGATARVEAAIAAQKKRSDEVMR